MSITKKSVISKSGVIMLLCVTLLSAVAVVAVTGSVRDLIRGSAADELRRRNDTQARLTAESGLLVATSLFGSGGLSGPVRLDLDSSEVTIEAMPDGADSGYVRVASTVRRPDLDYDKRVEWQVRVAPEGSAEGGGLIKKLWREADVPRGSPSP